MANRETALNRALPAAALAARAIEPRAHHEIISARYLTVPVEEFAAPVVAAGH